MNYNHKIKEHFIKSWGNNFMSLQLKDGPMHMKHPSFEVLVFSPVNDRDYWVYTTCGMSSGDKKPIELHICSIVADDTLIELLTSVAFFHLENSELDLNHTVSFGRSWQSSSICDYGFISLPYLYGPELEDFTINNSLVKNYWLIPVTEREVEFKKKNGAESLEDKFEETQFDFINPSRLSII